MISARFKCKFYTKLILGSLQYSTYFPYFETYLRASTKGKYDSFDEKKKKRAFVCIVSTGQKWKNQREVEGNVYKKIIATDKKVLFDMTYVSQS